MEVVDSRVVEGVEPEPEALVSAVRAAQRGDREAFGIVVEILWLPLVRFSRSILAARAADAEDLVQEALLHAWDRLPRLRNPAAIRPWLHRSVARRCFQHSRREARRRSEPLVEIGIPASNHLERDVVRLLDQLSPRQRAVFHLSALEGQSDSEIATRLGMLPPTVRVHRMRARRRLRQLLGDPS